MGPRDWLEDDEVYRVEFSVSLYVVPKHPGNELILKREVNC